MKQIVTKIDNKVIVHGGGANTLEELNNLKPHEVLMVDNHDGSYDFITRDKKYSEGNGWKLAISYYAGGGNGGIMLMANKKSEIELLADNSYVMTLFAKKTIAGDLQYDEENCYIDSSATMITDDMIIEFIGVNQAKIAKADTLGTEDVTYYDYPLADIVGNNIVSFVDTTLANIAELIISDVNGFPTNEDIINVKKFRIKEWV